MKTAMAHTEVALQNILVATDFSSTSEKALRYAMALANRYHSRIHLAHMIQPAAIALAPPDTTSCTYEQVHQAAARSLKEEARQLGGLRHKTYLMNGTASELVESLVLKNHIDLVIVGTHGAKGFEKFVLGSTAEEIFRNATCPVLTVGPNAPVLDSGRGLKCILFPTDLESDESEALAHAISLAERYSARLLLLHVMFGMQPPPADEIHFFEERYLHRLSRLIPDGVQLPHPAECRVEYLEPAPDAILRVAAEEAADLIVLSVRPKEAWATRLPDKASRIVARALCPVLTVREKRSA